MWLIKAEKLAAEIRKGLEKSTLKLLVTVVSDPQGGYMIEIKLNRAEL